ncbi:hypothetical protein [Sodalis praecaptivus]|uniref:hypothetical protein n=1 Tax=Sodalis praecaptivus TaxID=1239307 RepID=UPI00280B98E7|nr:hypothetical protein [Sodalis praecaptivus]
MTSASAAAPLAKESQTVLRVGVASRLGQDLWFKASGEDQHLPYTVQWVNFDAAPPAMDALLADSIDTFWGGTPLPCFSLITSARPKSWRPVKRVCLARCW